MTDGFPIFRTRISKCIYPDPSSVPPPIQYDNPEDTLSHSHPNLLYSKDRSIIFFPVHDSHLFYKLTSQSRIPQSHCHVTFLHKCYHWAFYFFRCVSCRPHRKYYRIGVMRCKPHFPEFLKIRETIFFITQQPPEGQGLLIIETSRSNSFRQNTLSRTPLGK